MNNFQTATNLLIRNFAALQTSKTNHSKNLKTADNYIFTFPKYGNYQLAMRDNKQAFTVYLNAKTRSGDDVETILGKRDVIKKRYPRDGKPSSILLDATKAPYLRPSKTNELLLVSLAEPEQFQSFVERYLSIAHLPGPDSEVEPPATVGASSTDPATSVDDSLEANIDFEVAIERDPKIRKLIEEYAMQHAQKHYSHSFDVKILGKPFDLLCTREDEIVHVEVKGTRGHGNSVIVTRNEIKDARNANWRSDLYIVHGIQILGVGESRMASGGSVFHIEGWSPDDAQLEPLAFSYKVPHPGQ